MDAKHFPDFYRDNLKRIYKFFYFRVSGKREIAEDLTQDVFVKALAAFDTYDPETSKSAWLYTIARNHFVNYLEKAKPTVDLEEVDHLPLGQVDWPEEMASKHDQGRLLEALGQLPQVDQDLIRWKFLEGWRYEAISQILDKSAATLRVQAHRALKALKAILQQK